MTSTIGILDYSMGNLRSVQKALECVGAEAVIVSSPDELSPLDKLVLPGVGAFADGADHLNESGLNDAIRGFIATDKPFLGICLGMQLLFDQSEEDAPNQGLSILPGRVVRFNEDRGGQRIKVPHMGWNTLSWTDDEPLLAGLEPGCHVYFVHGYYVEPADPADVLATCDYAGPFCAMVRRDNVWATQFHPEKSQRVGMTILQNFVNL